MIGKKYVICIFTETWLRPIDSVAVNELCPAGYVFKNFARPSDIAGGGTGIMFRDSLDVSLVEGKEHFSFEYSEWNIMVQNRSVKVVAVYRPPYSENHQVTPNVFFEEFAIKSYL